ncbi:hypothetical protein TSMEX_009248 [Taenia solium]|eukprot:TsM_000496700 transcript=TsM_000496700 gene=TsM_000496700
MTLSVRCAQRVTTVVPKLSVRNVHLQDVNTDVVTQITIANRSKEFLIYDYPGSPVYHDLFDKFVDTTDVFVLMFDVSDRSSFEMCPLWIQKVKELAKGISVPGILIGNKTDLISRRAVTEIEAKRFAEEAGIKYCELSIKEARNVLEPLNILARDFYELYQSTADRFREML